MPPHFQVLEDNLRVGQGLVCLFGIEFLVWSGLVFFFFSEAGFLFVSLTALEFTL